MPTPYDDPPRLPPGERVHIGALFAGEGPFELEIGPGRGAFLLGRAAAQPDARLLGLEARRKWACIVDERLRRAGLGARARVVCENARLALRRLDPDGAVARVYVLFPDPWWKKRHFKRRLLDRALLDELCRLLGAGGELFVQTDVEDRAGAYADLLAGHPLLEPAGEAPGSLCLADNPYGAQSNRERRCEKDGVPIYRLRARRRPT